MASRDLTFRLNAQDVNASSTLGSVGEAGEKMSTKIGGAISSLGDKIGGELGEVLNTVGEGFTKFGESGMQMGTKLAVAGAGIAGLGVLLTSLGSSEKAAEQQLSAAINATGQSMSDYSDKIDKVISKSEDFGHSASDADNALATLTEATGDTQQALQSMGLVEDLAAAKHENLASAASQVAKIFGGSGSKLLKQYGIDMTVAAGNTSDFDAAVTALDGKLSGQAAAASDTFTGKIDSIKEHVQGFVAEIANEVGPALTFFGTGLGIVGSVMDILTAKATRAIEAEEKLGDAAKEATAASEAGNAASEIGSEGMLAGLGPVGLAIGGVTIAAGLGAAAWALFTGNEKKAAQPISGLTNLLSAQNGALNNNTKAAVATAAGAKGLFTQTDKLGFSQGSLTDGLNGNTDAYNANVGALKAAITAGTTYTKVSTGSRTGDQATLPVLDAKAQAATKALSAYEGLNASIGVNVKQAKDQVAANQTVTTSLIPMITELSAAAQQTADMSDNMLAAAQSADSFEGDLQNLTSAVKAQKTAKDAGSVSLSISTAAGLANNQAVLAAISAAKQHADAVYKQTGNISLATAALHADEGQLVTTATKAGLNTAQVKYMVSEYGKVPGDIATQVSLNTTNAMANMRNYENALAAMPKTAITNAGTYGGYNAKSHAASGGIIGDAGGGITQIGDTKVNEFGGEGLDLASMRVIPHGQWDQMKGRTGSGGGNTYITVNLQGIVSGTAADVGRFIATNLTSHVQAGGKVKIASGVI